MPFIVRIYIGQGQGVGAASIPDATPTSDGVMTAAQAARLAALDPSAAGGIYPSVFACAADLTVNEAVYLSASDVVARANASSPSTMPCIGFVFSKPTPTTCLVLHHGELVGLVGLVIGQPYYISTTAGALAKVGDAGMPTLSGQVVQPIGRPRSATSMMVSVDANIVTLDIL